MQVDKGKKCVDLPMPPRVNDNGEGPYIFYTEESFSNGEGSSTKPWSRMS